MTAKQVFEAMLIETSKVHASTLMLDDFNYFFNKAINQYINKRYSIYDMQQQTTDDIRVLKSTATLTPQITNAYDNMSDATSALSVYNQSIANLFGVTYEVNLPSDYFHMLNCICIFKVKKKYNCWDAGTYVQFGATKLDSDKWGQIINDFYNRPSFKRPYYFLHNVNTKLSENENKHDANYINEFTNEFNINTPGTTDMVTGDTSKFPQFVLSNGLKVIVEATQPPGSAMLGDNLMKWIENKTIKFVDEDVQYLIENYVYGDMDPKTSNCSIIKQENDDNYYIIRTPNGSTSEKGYLCENPNTKKLYSGVSTDPNKITVDYQSTKSGEFPRTLVLQKNSNEMPITVDLVQKESGSRHANVTGVRMEIRYGKDNSVFELAAVLVDYIKAPQFIRLTQEQIDLTEDTSQILEFPDYVCQEIINELTTLVMENNGDPRLQSHYSVSQSIAQPAQAQTQSAAPAQRPSRSAAAQS